MEVTAEGFARFFEVVLPHLNELQRRMVIGAAAEMVGNKTAVAAASGMSRNTVIKAQGEVEAGIEPSERQRAPGGGDRPAIEKQPGLLEALDELIHPDTRGNPMSLLRWTSKSSTNLADGLVAKGFEVSSRTVLRLLHQLGYSLQANAKVTEGRQHPDRDGQFRYLNNLAQSFVDDGEPVISVDTKKKELIGDYANGGREWAESGKPERTQVHDFPDPELGENAKAIPYGIYDVGNNEGWVAEVLKIGVEDSLAHVERAVDAMPPEATPLEVLREAIRAAATSVIEIGDYAAANSRIFSMAPEAVRKEHYTLQQKYADYLHQLLQAAVDSGELRQDLDLPVVGMLMFGSINWTTEWYRPGRGRSSQVVIEHLVDMVLSGLEAA